MRPPKIKYLVLLGLLATWAASKKKSRSLKADGGQRGLAPLVEDDSPTQMFSPDDEEPNAVNPFPKGNPTPLPTGPAPGG